VRQSGDSDGGWRGVGNALCLVVGAFDRQLDGDRRRDDPAVFRIVSRDRCI
jgi:hypothetical protein